MFVGHPPCLSRVCRNAAIGARGPGNHFLSRRPPAESSSSSPRPATKRRGAVSTPSLRTHEHARTHLEVQRVAEVRAVAPEHARLVGDEGDGLRLQRVPTKLMSYFGIAKPCVKSSTLSRLVRIHGDLVAHLDLELAQAEAGACEAILTVTLLPSRSHTRTSRSLIASGCASRPT